MSDTAPLHYGQQYAGQTLLWMPTDTEEHYHKLMQDPGYAQYIHEQGWDRDGAITYKINSDGFRCAEFDDSACIMAFGCSFTVGIGLPLESIWPELVGRELGLRVANMSWGGYSADSCFRLAEYWIPRLRPQLVVMMAPPEERFEFLWDPDQVPAHQRTVGFEIVMASQDIAVRNSDLIRHWFGNKENHRLNSQRNRLAIERLCQVLDIQCVTDSIMRHMWWSREKIGHARDMMHGGPPAHIAIAEHVLHQVRSA